MEKWARNALAQPQSRSQPGPSRTCSGYPTGCRCARRCDRCAGVATAHRDEQPRHRAGVRGGEEQMDVIGHRHLGVQATALSLQGLVQSAQIGVPVLVVEEAGAAVVARRHDTQQRPVEMDAGSAKWWPFPLRQSGLIRYGLTICSPCTSLERNRARELEATGGQKGLARVWPLSPRRRSHRRFREMPTVFRVGPYRFFILRG